MSAGDGLQIVAGGTPALGKGLGVFPVSGAKGDGVQLLDASISSASKVLSSSHVFTQSDVGKLAMVVGAGAVTGGVQGPLVTTVESVSAGVATLVAAASTTTAAVGSSSTTISGASGTGGALPTGTDSIPVASSAGYVAGNTVTIGTGGAAETFVVIGVPDSTHIDIEGSTALAHTNGDTVAVGGTVAFICTDETAVIQSVINTVSQVFGGGRVVLPHGLYGLNATGLVMASGVTLEGESRWSTRLEWFRSGSVPGQPAGIVVPPGVTKWAIRELDIAGAHWSGGAWITAAEAGIMVQGGTSHGRIRGVRAHNTDNSGILVAIVSQSIATANNNYDVVIEDCEAWGTGEDGIELNHGSPGVGMKTDRVVVRDCVSHHNFLDGFEVDGAAAGALARLTITGNRAYRNGASGFAFDGAAGHETQRAVVSDNSAYLNTTHGFIFNLCRYFAVSNLLASDNTTIGVRFTASNDISTSNLVTPGNLVRGVYMDTACTNISIEADATGCGASSNAGQAAIEIDNSGGACSDINVRARVKGNSRAGVIMKGVTRGHIEAIAVGNGTLAADIGVILNACADVTGVVRAYGNTNVGYKTFGSCTNCAIVGFFGPGASAAQITGWTANAGDSGCVVHDVVNTCGTPFTNLSTSKQLRASRQRVHQYGVTGADYTIKVHDSLIAISSLAATHTFTLPAASAVVIGQEYVIKDQSGNAGTNALTINTAGGNIDGAASTTISTNYGFKRFYSDGTNWFTC